MTESSTICIGSELFTVMANLRSRGCNVWSLDTAVAGNAGYRVRFYERVTEESQSVSGRNRNSGHAGPAALANLECRAPFVGDSPEAPGCKTSGVAITATTTNEKRGECDGKSPSHSMPISIENRIKNLYEKAVKSGRVRTRFKSTIPGDEARKPYAD